jgi:hypothetical protein
MKREKKVDPMRAIVTAIMIASVLLGGPDLAQPESTGPAENASRQPQVIGDDITLRSGRTLLGVRVLEETPTELRVEVLPGIPPLVLPVRQIKSIRYGRARPTPLRKKAGDAPDETGPKVSVLLPATKIAPEFSRRLARKNKGENKRFTGEDLAKLLEKVARDQSTRITFSRNARREAETMQNCEAVLNAGQTLDSFLQKTIADTYPRLKIDYLFDEIAVSLKSDNASTLRENTQNK